MRELPWYRLCWWPCETCMNTLREPTATSSSRQQTNLPCMHCTCTTLAFNCTALVILYCMCPVLYCTALYCRRSWSGCTRPGKPVTMKQHGSRPSSHSAASSCLCWNRRCRQQRRGRRHRHRRQQSRPSQQSPPSEQQNTPALLRCHTFRLQPSACCQQCMRCCCRPSADRQLLDQPACTAVADASCSCSCSWLWLFACDLQ